MDDSTSRPTADPTPTSSSTSRSTTRRRLLGGAAIGGATLLAGCSDQLGVGDDGGDGGDGDGEGDGAGVIAVVDQQAMQQEQLAIQQNASTGNMSSDEAQAALDDLQEEYVGGPMDSLAETIEGTDGVESTNEYDSLAAVTVTGDDQAIMGLLDAENVSAIVSTAEVEELAETQNVSG